MGAGISVCEWQSPGARPLVGRRGGFAGHASVQVAPLTGETPPDGTGGGQRHARCTGRVHEVTP